MGGYQHQLGKSTPNENQFGNNQTGNPELPGSKEDSDNDYFTIQCAAISMNVDSACHNL